jgi:type II secretory pathway component PulL
MPPAAAVFSSDDVHDVLVCVQGNEGDDAHVVTGESSQNSRYLDRLAVNGVGDGVRVAHADAGER